MLELARIPTSTHPTHPPVPPAPWPACRRSLLITLHSCILISSFYRVFAITPHPNQTQSNPPRGLCVAENSP